MGQVESMRDSSCETKLADEGFAPYSAVQCIAYFVWKLKNRYGVVT